MSHNNGFLDFPIDLLRGFLDNPDRVLADIFFYSAYKMLWSESSVFGSMEEFRKQYGFTIDEKGKKHGESIFNSFDGIGHVWTGIHIDTFKRYYKKERSEIDLVCLLAFLGLKSISQKARFKKNVTNEFLMSRMSGYGSTVPIEQIDPTVLEYMKNKSKRKPKVFRLLEESFKFARVEKSRGITYSFEMSRRELELKILKDKYLKSDEYKNAERRKERELVKQEFEKWKASVLK